MSTGHGKAPALQIRFFGGLAVHRHGLPATLPPSKKSRALLAYLAATGQPHLRDHLCDLLWDGPDDPRAQLRWSLAKLRPLVDDGKLVRLRAERDRVTLDAAGVEMDLAVVRGVVRRGLREVSAGELEDVAARLAGTFLEGLELASCYRFHVWCIGLREEMHATHVAALTTLVERLRGSPEDALRHARALVALDPLAESSHVTVVALLDELGRTREAHDAYERWRVLLARELSGKPSREMEVVRMAIGGRAAGSAGAAVRPPNAALGSVSPPFEPTSVRAKREDSLLRAELVGRAVEMAILGEKLDAACARQGREVVLLLGDPGIGKSRLLEELATRARGIGGQVLSGRAFECELVRPYGAWIDALRAGGGAVASLPAPEASPLARAASPSPSQPGVEEAERQHMFEAVLQTLVAAARERAPLLVLLDDIQWLDEASVALLHFVARALEGQPILIACAARSGELSDNPGVLRLVRTLDRDHRLHRMALSPLDAAAIAELVAAISHPDDVPAVVAGVVEAVLEGSDGNPLFAIELARAGLAGAASVTPTLGALIGERLDRLDERARALLPFAAALGRSFEPRILARALDMPPVEFFSALGELERRGVLRASGPDSYDFSHDLVRQAAYQGLSEPRRRLIHLQLARVLSSWEDPDGELKNDLAHHASLGGDRETAARAYLAAADRSVRLFAWAEASELVRRGVQQLPGLNRSTRLRLHVDLLGVEVLGKSSPQRARDLDLELLRLLSAAEEAGVHAIVARAFYLRSVLQFRGGNSEGAVETSWRMVVAGRAGDALTAARSQAEAGRCLILIERDVAKAKDLLEEANTILTDRQDDLILNWGLGLLRRYTGDTDEAAGLLRQAAVLARRNESHWEEMECLRALTILEIENGHFAAARARCPAMLELAAKMGEGSERAIAEALESLAGVLERDRETDDGHGRHDGDHADVGDERLTLALGRVREADAKAMLATLLNFAAQNDLVRGRPERARQRAREALTAAHAVARTNQGVIASALLARLALRTGDRAGAEALLHPARAVLSVPFALSSHARRLAEGALSEFDAHPEDDARSSTARSR